MRTLLLIVFLLGTTPTSPEPKTTHRDGPAREMAEAKEARLKLKRAQLDQSLIRAERSARMLTEFETLAPRAQAGGRP